jgi:hypothetical protein
MDDPRAVLGVGPDATGAQLRRARRRLAKQLHPDLHGDGTRADAERRMAQVNRAFDELLGALAVPPAPAGPAAPDGAVQAPGGAAPDAFAIEALPVDAFEATLLAAVELGDVIRAEEPYLLAVLLDDPAPCQCLLELVPDAGGTTVTIDLAPRHVGTPPTVEAVRDALVAEIGRQMGA